MFFFFFFFNDTATTEIYTLSLHDALPIYRFQPSPVSLAAPGAGSGGAGEHGLQFGDRKSTRLNSSHTVISYAVFCLKKKKNHHGQLRMRCGRLGPLSYLPGESPRCGSRQL